MASAEKPYYIGTDMNCGGACLLKAYVKDGVIVRMETDDGGEPQLRNCLRCRAYRQRVYAPDRILYPLKRVGERGEGNFERISWDEALEKVANEYKRVKETYGPAAVIYLTTGGDMGQVHNTRTAVRVFSLAGGCTLMWGIASNEGWMFACQATYGYPAGNDHRDLINSKLVILWGMNPVNIIDGCGTSYALARATEAGTRFIVVDPRFTDTAALVADRWIPIRPGTDAAAMIAMAYVMITEDLHDKRFLDTYTAGFDRFKEYVLGEEDGVPKTPAWAERITNIPAQTIGELAREYATAKPAALLPSKAPGRTAYGEQYHRAAFVLAAMTGNIGIPGGSAGSEISQRGETPFPMGPAMRTGGNPVDAASPRRRDALPTAISKGPGLLARLHNSEVIDAILKGKAGGYYSDYKMVYTANTNYLNQYPNVNKAVKALKSLEFIAIQEQFITPTAKFADIILPTCTFFERNDAVWGAGPHLAYQRKVIEPLGESRSHLDICTGLAQKLGIADYSDKTEEEWLEQIMRPAVTDYERFKETGVEKFYLEPSVPFKREIEDPANNPFPTPSGKIEIYSQQLADIENPLIPPIPKYIETWESLNEPLAEKYPLQLISTHFKRRAHSQFDNIPWLRELEPQAVKINTHDAQARGIKDGDPVRVFNDRGEMIIPAKVTQRIMPSVVDVPEGAWYDPDKQGVDRGGCANVLTRDARSPGGAFTTNTCLVQVEKA
ncbi:MAG: dimethyl sulfoxide reductase subunit A [Dehalococcoidia bacterium]|nr:MAG: dimethyl sulfoxide reductase subunit A [Dehalococcoidia bacterium]